MAAPKWNKSLYLSLKESVVSVFDLYKPLAQLNILTVATVMTVNVNLPIFFIILINKLKKHSSLIRKMHAKQLQFAMQFLSVTVVKKLNH